MSVRDEPVLCADPVTERIELGEGAGVGVAHDLAPRHFSR